MDGTVDRKALAKMLGVTERQIRNYERGHPALPSHLVDGQRVYRLTEVFRWQHERGKEEARRTSEQASYERAKARKMQAEADKAELELAEMRGELITVDVHREVLGEIADRMTAKVLAIPSTWAPRLVGLESERTANAALRPMSRELLEELGEAAGEVEDPDDEDVPADFPGVKPLRTAGVLTWGEVRGVEDLTSIAGIGPATERKILERLAARDGGA